MDEFELFRLRVIGAAVPDPGRAWDSSSSYATVDKRLVSPDDVERSIREAEESLRQYVSTLYDGLRPVFRAFYEGRRDEAAQRLVSLGEQMEAMGRLKGARQCYRAALTLTFPLQDKAAQILALRRIARASLALGDFTDAAQHYERTAQLARDAGDLRGEVVARTGLANVLVWQGGWAEAEGRYRDALALAERGGMQLAQEVVPLLYNLGMLATRLERPDEAEEWLGRALERALEDGSPVDVASCWINLAQLRERQGRFADAYQAYDRARALPVPPAFLSAIASDLAELCIRDGHVSRAQEWGRVAEEHAIASGSVYILGRMYQGRGNIARAQGDEDGFTFFEKALEIARDKGYPVLEAETLADYADLRRQSGGAEEAVAYLERARELFTELGAMQDVARMDRALGAARTELPAAAD